MEETNYAQKFSGGVLYDGVFWSDGLPRPSWMNSYEGVERQNKMWQTEDLKRRIERLEDQLSKKKWYQF